MALIYLILLSTDGESVYYARVYSFEISQAVNKLTNDITWPQGVVVIHYEHTHFLGLDEFSPSRVETVGSLLTCLNIRFAPLMDRKYFLDPVSFSIECFFFGILDYFSLELAINTSIE
ncbi:hypothetical protein EDC94DRAFT_682774 [Helicostylum pulchrum]|nr:hypothetical protein EDC94DRAFT_682774 [Helicostylum pulchrum]